MGAAGGPVLSTLLAEQRQEALIQLLATAPSSGR